MIKKKKKLFIKLGCLLSALALVFTFTFVGVHAEDSDYETGYNDGYAQGVEDSFSNLSNYSVISNYYQNAIVFISQDYGVTFQSASSYIQATRNSDLLNITSSNGFSVNDNVQYYISLNLTSPCNIKDVMFFATDMPTPLKVVIDSTEFGFTYTNIDNVGYMWSNQIMLKASTIKIYFKGRSNMDSSFSIKVNGYDTSMESYENGYNKGVSDTEARLNPTISELRSNINVLTQEISTLQEQLSNNFGWQSLFFGMADTPFYTISHMLGFELFGINLFNALIGLITVLACFWLFKKLIH